MMALLVSMGAPFWYDVLKAIMGVKNKLKPATAAIPPKDYQTEGGSNEEAPAIG